MKVEKVVNPPRNPIENKRLSSLFKLNELTKPIKKEPDILIINVDKGNDFLYFLVKVSWIRNLVRLPKAPPIQTNKRFNYFTSPSCLIIL